MSRSRKARLVAAAAVCACALGGTVPRAAADYAVLRNGQRLQITGLEQLGDTVRLAVPGGSVTLAAGDLVRVEPEEARARPQQPKPAAAPQLGVAGAPYGQQIRAAATAYALDPLLIESVIAVESNFNPRAVSPKSARGLMQLMPKTSSSLSVVNAFDPVENIDGGARYLRAMLDRYHQDLVLALAAYNAGPDAVDSYRGVPPFAETRFYVAHVLARLLHSHQASNRQAAAVTPAR